MTRARIVKVVNRIAHPNADRLDVLEIEWPHELGASFHPYTQEVVTGKHYVPGQLGVHIPEGAILPGPLAVDLWMWGAKSDKPWLVEAKVMRGIRSSGVFSGREYRVDPNDPRSIEKHEQHSAAGDELLPDGSYKWALWKDHWQLGDDVTDELGSTGL